MLAIGAIAERGRLGAIMVFVFVWSTIVYDPIAQLTVSTPSPILRVKPFFFSESMESK